MRVRAAIGGREPAVSDVLQPLSLSLSPSPSSFRTYQAKVVAPDPDAATTLEAAAIPRVVAIEDGSAIRIICAACSEGTHAHHEIAEPPWTSNRLFSIAALDEAAALERVHHWMEGGSGRTLQSIECVFAHDERRVHRSRRELP